MNVCCLSKLHKNVTVHVLGSPNNTSTKCGWTVLEIWKGQTHKHMQRFLAFQLYGSWHYCIPAVFGFLITYLYISLVFPGYSTKVCRRSIWDVVQYSSPREHSSPRHQIHVWLPGWAGRQTRHSRHGRTSHVEKQLVRTFIAQVTSQQLGRCDTRWIYSIYSLVRLRSQRNNFVRLLLILFVSVFQPSIAFLGKRDQEPAVCVWHP